MASNASDTVSGLGKSMIDSSVVVKVVGIGASAGGLEALKEVLSGIAEGTDRCFIIAQHLSPHHGSMLVELLGRETRLRVVEARAGELLESACVYITPPNRDVEISDGRIMLFEPAKEQMPKPSVNRLFSSLARQQGAEAIGIVLSGTGTDGAMGLADIRDAGGIAIAQDPATSKYDGMPRAAIESGGADVVLKPAEVGPFLARLASGEQWPPQEAATVSVMDAIIAVAHRETGLDFSQYKRTTLLRRIHRRMSLCRVDTEEKYLQLLKNKAEEVHQFSQDVFISVTRFFRDPEVFERLSRLLEQQFREMDDGSEFRVWVPGCASGEEAYTLAILIEEAQKRAGKVIEHKVFATDISQRPLAAARAGLYSQDSVAEMPHELLERYFVRNNLVWQISRRIRDRVVFSAHDMSRDPPFSRMDLVTCRNVLIYFNQELQRRVLNSLHYALKPTGILLLGTAENVSVASDMFTTVDALSRIYRKEGISQPPKLTQASAPRERLRPIQGERLEDIERRMQRVLAARFAPCSVVINATNELMYAFGDPSGLFEIKPGPASLDFLSLITESLRPAVRALIFKARRATSEEERSLSAIAVADLDRPVRLQVMEFDPARAGWLMLALSPQQHSQPTFAASAAGSDEETFRILEQELKSTRESLQTVIEELETNNEEMQSTNEELITVNDELSQKSAALTSAITDQENILGSLPTPLIVVGEDLRLHLTSPATEALLPLAQVLSHDGLLSLPWRTEIPGLRETVQSVMRTGERASRPVVVGARQYQLQVTPFRDEKKAVRGAVLIFNDITEIASVQRSLMVQEERLRTTLASISDGVLRINRDGSVEYANPVAKRLLESTGTATGVEADIDELHQLQLHLGDMKKSLRDLLQPAWNDGSPVNLSGVRLLSENGEKVFEITAIPLHQSHGQQHTGAVVAVRDVTERSEVEARLLWAGTHDDLTGLVNRREFEQRLADACAETAMGSSSMLLYFDLDQFKMVNDDAGHAAGDELLCQAARMIGLQLRPQDTVARIGGDEFCILLRDAAMATAMQIAERIRSMFESYRFSWGDKLYTIGISVGIAKVGDDSTQVLAEADAACLSAKQNGRNRIEVSSPDNPLVQLKRNDFHAARHLEQALAQGRLFAHFERMAPVANQTVQRWEYLSRLRAEDGSTLMPGAFIPAAERYGTITLIDRYTISQALELVQRAPDGMPLRMHVNVSAASIGLDSFVAWLLAELQRLPAAADRLTLEITETVAMSNLTQAISFTESVRSTGAEVFLDDFGTGNSALNFLQVMPVDGIKIDGAFVRHIDKKPLDKVIVTALQSIANTLGIITVAEFAETPAILRELTAAGVGYAQGHAVDRGCDMATLERLWSSYSILSG